MHRTTHAATRTTLGTLAALALAFSGASLNAPSASADPRGQGAGSGVAENVAEYDSEDRVHVDPPSAFEEDARSRQFTRPVRDVSCIGDGTSGRRVKLLYVHGDSQPSRLDELAGTFREWAARMDAVILRAAQRTGGVRHIRYATQANCQPSIDSVSVSDAAMDDPLQIADALAEQGYDRTDRQYVVWYDHEGCGLAFSPTANGPNTGPDYATVGTSCFGWAPTLHELLHTLGAVDPSAPHGTAGSHCWDDEDVMCYDDGGIPDPPGELVLECPDSWENTVDCEKDDYFNTHPPPGSYLDTNFNVADNLFLTEQGPVPDDNTGAITGIAGMCVDVDSSNTANGTAIQLWGCNGTDAQVWTTPGDGTIRAFGKCMDVTDGGTENWTKVQLWGCNGTGAQQWSPQPNGTLVNPASGKCLDTWNGGTDNGTRLIIYTCHGEDNQQWQLPE